ncbi:MAG: hypothetical protein HYR49_09165 [Gammaproteobacteria bacterium]|nr:hypothetical protein [Gammaproteobacteria bacterium]
MTDTLPGEQFEQAYELIAQAIDRVGPDKERLFLARLALALAHRLPDLDAVRQALAIAKNDVLRDPDNRGKEP